MTSNMSSLESLQSAGAEKRERIRLEMEVDAARRDFTGSVARTIREARWRDKTSASPLTQDLVAIGDRADAEAQMKAIEKQRSRTESVAARTSVRQALTAALTSDDVEVRALREQRRKIESEERRLKALLEIEKANMIRRDEYHAARIALRQRREVKVRERREELGNLQKQRMVAEKVVAKMGVGLEPPPMEIILGLRAMYAPAPDVVAMTLSAGSTAEGDAGLGDDGMGMGMGSVGAGSGDMMLQSAPGTLESMSSRGGFGLGQQSVIGRAGAAHMSSGVSSMASSQYELVDGEGGFGGEGGGAEAGAGWGPRAGAAGRGGGRGGRHGQQQHHHGGGSQGSISSEHPSLGLDTLESALRVTDLG
jgi:hypothetical protein